MSRKNIRLGWFGRGNIYDIETAPLVKDKATTTHVAKDNLKETLYVVETRGHNGEQTEEHIAEQLRSTLKNTLQNT